jgi:hypothetical protein
MGSGPVSDRAHGAGPSRRLILRLRSPLTRPGCGEGGPSCVMPILPRLLLLPVCRTPRHGSVRQAHYFGTRVSLHDGVRCPIVCPRRSPRRSASAWARGLHPSLPFAPVPRRAAVPEPWPPCLPRHQQRHTCAPGSRHGLLPASGLQSGPAGALARLGRGARACGVGAGGRAARWHGTGWTQEARGKGRVNFLYFVGIAVLFGVGEVPLILHLNTQHQRVLSLLGTSYEPYMHEIASGCMECRR